MAHIVTTGEQHNIDTRIPHQRLASLAGSMDEVEYAGRKARLHEQFGETLADGWRILRRLENNGIAFEQAGAQHPQRHSEGKIPRRDNSDDAPRLAAHESIFLGNLGGQYVARRHASGAEDVLNHVQAFNHLSLALADDLSTFARHQPGEVIRFALD